MSETYAVIGAGPLGSCAARALADHLDVASPKAQVHLIDANNPLEQKFDVMSAAGPHAAGQLMLHVFDGESASKPLTRRSHELLKQFADEGDVDLHMRPWICCAGNSDSELDRVTQDVLAQSHREGRFEGCELVRSEELPETVGLRRDQVAWALLDPTTMAVNPRVYVQQLVNRAIKRDSVIPRFDTRVNEVTDTGLVLEHEGQTFELKVDGIILCTGIHRDLLTSSLPSSRPEYLHVTEHHNDRHLPEVMHLITGETTIARYAGFGPHRSAITELLDEEIRELGIHGLFTDVPGLRRMLDSHFEHEVDADGQNDRVWELLRSTIGRYVQPEYLLGTKTSNRIANRSYVAAYTKLLESDGPYLEVVSSDLPAVYVQPSNGLGLNQCAALGFDAAERLMSHCA